MRKSQKFILMAYVLAVFFLSFVYVPITRFYQFGSKQYLGHHLRPRLLELIFMEQEVHGRLGVDAQMIIAEVLALTAITVALFIYLRR